MDGGSILDHLKVIVQCLDDRFAGDTGGERRDGGEDSPFGHIG